ncbi:hypothetical protein [Cytobacillus gottheilii]|nr:hypothetical protein [Cytobacillus gottheilii]
MNSSEEDSTQWLILRLQHKSYSASVWVLIGLAYRQVFFIP